MATTNLVAKDPNLTDFDDDLHKKMALKSHIIEWITNTDTYMYVRESLSMQSHCSGIVQSRTINVLRVEVLKNVILKAASFHVN